MPVELHVLLLEPELAAVGYANLLEDQIHIGDHLGHRMLDLDAGVHLDEIKFTVLVQEFDGADAEIVDVAHGLRDGFADRVARRRVQGGRGAFFPDLLMAALQRAVALAEVDGAALAVAKHLDFDVARPLEIFFEIDRIVPERDLGFGPRARQRQGQFGFGAHDLHAASAAAGGRLDQHRKTNIARNAERVRVRADAAIGTWHDRNAEATRGALRLDLLPHQADMLGLRTG